MECVLLVLRGERADLREWEDAFTLAEQEHVLPLFVARLREREEALPDEVLERCIAVERETAISSFWWVSELKNILHGFAEENMAVILLKGPALAERVYGGVALRPCRDLDLLVRLSDVGAAGVVLRRLGFAADRRADDYHRGWRRGSTVVELHVDVENPLAFDFEIEEAWGRARAVEFGGEPARILGAADELLFLCLHGVRHRYERLSHVLDAAQAFQRLGNKIGCVEYSKGAQYKLRRLIVLGHAIARKIDVDVRLPEGFSGCGKAVRMEAVAERLWADLLERPGIALDWQAQHRFYVQLESSGIGRAAARAAHLRILATRLIEADFAYAEKYGIRHAVLVWMLRQLRLARQFIGKPRRRGEDGS